jgi:hypothetical protein
LKLIFKQWNAGTNRNSVAQDRDGWRAVLKVATNLWVP